MKQSKWIVWLLLVFIVGAIFVASNTFLLTSKYGQELSEADASIRWEFFHEQLVTTQEAESVYGQGEAVRVLPHRFEEHYGTAQTYGSYVARFTIPEKFIGERVAFYIPYEFGSYALYVDGQLIMQNGRVGTSKEQQVPRNAPVIGQATFDEQEVLVVLQLANFYSDRGGLTQAIQIGEPEQIIVRHNTSIILYFFMNGIIFVIGLYMLFFGMFNQRHKPTLLLALFSLTIAVRSLFARPYIYAITIFNVPWDYAVRMEMICTLISTSLVVSFCYYWFQKYISRYVIGIVYSAGIVQMLFVVVTEPVLFQKTFSYLYSVSLTAFLYIIAIACSKFRTLTNLELFQFIGMSIVFFATLHDFFVVHLMLERPVLVQVAVGLFVTIQVVIMSWQYAQKLKETVQLNAEVMELNTNLDAKIKARTEQLEELNAQLEILASQDALTGIGNRHTFDERLLFYFDYAKVHHCPVSLLLIDLDNFKKYNDYYGHTMGDTLLKQVVVVIDEMLPAEAVFTRYGGEEFAVIVPHMTKRQLLFLGNDIVQAVAQQRFEHACHDAGIVTVSVGGYTMLPEDDFTYTKEFIDAADKQLYLAKQFGRNMCVTS